jgi:phosphatidate cytidylyltransferase
MSSAGRELASRLAVALIGIPAAVGIVYLGGYWLAALLALLAALAAREFARLYAGRGVPASPGVAAILAALYVALAAAVPVAAFSAAAVVATLIVASVISLRAAPETRPGQKVMTTVFGSTYSGILLAFGVWLRALDDAAPGLRGAAIVLLPVAITWLGDTAAYSVGKAIGRHRLAPAISPAKTWEGALAGLVATAAGALLYLELTRPIVSWTMGTLEVVGLGLAVAVAGQVGDLFESRFKRECGVKDSSNLLPGHGGVLDRLDSLLFVLPVSYAYLRLVGL